MPHALPRPIVLLLIAATLPLGACASGQESFPSLARRPIERISAAAPVAATTDVPPPAPPSAAVLNQIDLALAQARDADASFRQHENRTRQLVIAARTATIASEGWSVATIAVSDLESSRSNAMIALADLDALYAKARVGGEDTIAIGAARDQVIATIRQQDAVLADLKAALAN